MRLVVVHRCYEYPLNPCQGDGCCWHVDLGFVRVRLSIDRPQLEGGTASLVVEEKEAVGVGPPVH